MKVILEHPLKQKQRRQIRRPTNKSRAVWSYTPCKITKNGEAIRLTRDRTALLLMPTRVSGWTVSSWTSPHSSQDPKHQWFFERTSAARNSSLLSSASRQFQRLSEPQSGVTHTSGMGMTTRCSDESFIVHSVTIFTAFNQ